MDFYDQLRERGLMPLLSTVSYQPPSFINEGRVFQFLDDIVENQRSVAVIRDYDVDGAMCGEIAQDAFRLLGVEHAKLINYTERTHRLDVKAVYSCLQEHFDYVMICDTGSSDLPLVSRLVNEGSKVIIFDHHNTSIGYDCYGPAVAIINTELENTLLGKKVFCLSAGALTFCVLDSYLQRRGLEGREGLLAYAAISLFADCMEMSNDLNRSIYYAAKMIQPESLPYRIRLFMNENARFNARFINYGFAPKLNAAFRSENLDVLNKLLSDDVLASDAATAYNKLVAIYEQSREDCNLAVDTLRQQITELDHFILCNLRLVEPFMNVEEKKLWNYTGYIANKLASEFGRTALMYCQVGNEYKGSVRDPFGRNYLTLFQQLCYAGGHGPAFGVKINTLDFERVIKLLYRVDQHFSLDSISNEPIIVEWPYATLDPVVVGDMIKISELSGSAVPKVFLRKQNVGMVESKSTYGYSYRCGEYMFYAPHKLDFYYSYLFSPVQTKNTHFSLVED